jgi:hypothetical protein
MLKKAIASRNSALCEMQQQGQTLHRSATSHTANQHCSIPEDTMPHYGTLRAGGDYSTTEADDIRGASVYGMNDDKLGKIDDVICDHASGHHQEVCCSCKSAQ